MHLFSIDIQNCTGSAGEHFKNRNGKAGRVNGKKRSFLHTAMTSLLVCVLFIGQSVPIKAADSRYEALGDSIAYGYGLADRDTQSYVSLTAQSLGLPVSNAAVNGMTSAELFYMLDMTQSGEELCDNLQAASVITVSIGSNDLLGRLTAIAGNRMASVLGSDADEEDYQQLEETLTSDSAKDEFDAGIEEYRKNLPLLYDALRNINPDAQIVMTSFYNPYYGIMFGDFDYGSLCDEYIVRMNQVLNDGAETMDYKIADIYADFNQTGMTNATAAMAAMNGEGAAAGVDAAGVGAAPDGTNVADAGAVTGDANAANADAMAGGAAATDADAVADGTAAADADAVADGAAVTDAGAVADGAAAADAGAVADGAAVTDDGAVADGAAAADAGVVAAGAAAAGYDAAGAGAAAAMQGLDPHPNAAGHALIAQKVTAAVAPDAVFAFTPANLPVSAGETSGGEADSSTPGESAASATPAKVPEANAGRESDTQEAVTLKRLATEHTAYFVAGGAALLVIICILLGKIIRGRNR